MGCQGEQGHREGAGVGTWDLRELAAWEGQSGLTSLHQILALSGSQASWSLIFLYVCARMSMHVCAGMYMCKASEVMNSASFFSNVAQDRVPDRAHSRTATLSGHRQLGYPSTSQPDGLARLKSQHISLQNNPLVQ